jgi:hypothetical protein
MGLPESMKKRSLSESSMGLPESKAFKTWMHQHKHQHQHLHHVSLHGTRYQGFWEGGCKPDRVTVDMEKLRCTAEYWEMIHQRCEASKIKLNEKVEQEWWTWMHSNKGGDVWVDYPE